MKAQLKKLRDAIFDGFSTVFLVSLCYTFIIIFLFVVLGCLFLLTIHLELMDLSHVLSNIFFGSVFFTPDDIGDEKFNLSGLLFFAWGCFVSGFFISFCNDFPFRWNRDDF